MTHLENKIEWCLRKGKEKGHHGLKRTASSEKNTEQHIKKALHNLEAAEYNKERFQDWT